MKEALIKIGNTYYIKKHAKERFLRANQSFLVINKIKNKNNINKYYNEKGLYTTANNLTEIPCCFKKCPCH
jgi:hypothetical protein